MDRAVEPCFKLVPCPHCGRSFGLNKYPTHIRTCVDAPAIRTALAAALESNTPGVGITESEYRLISRERGTPATSTIRRRWGMWADVLAAFGLTCPQRNAPRTHTAATVAPRMTAKQREEAAIDDVAQMEADARRALAAEYDAAHTFNGYRVRDLPGVTVNGKPCQVIALR